MSGREFNEGESSYQLSRLENKVKGFSPWTFCSILRASKTVLANFLMISCLYRELWSSTTNLPWFFLSLFCNNIPCISNARLIIQMWKSKVLHFAIGTGILCGQRVCG